MYTSSILALYLPSTQLDNLVNHVTKKVIFFHTALLLNNTLCCRANNTYELF